MPDETALRHRTSVKVDLRKASKECGLPYLYSNVVSASRVGLEIALEFGSMNQNELAFAVQNKESEVEIGAKIHVRMILPPAAVFALRKQVEAIVEALVKENPQFAELAG